MNKSSHIKDSSYDSEANRLTVEFTNGRHYEYDGVPEEIHRGLQSANSPGSFFHQRIKPNFTGRQIRHNGA